MLLYCAVSILQERQNNAYARSVRNEILCLLSFAISRRHSQRDTTPFPEKGPAILLPVT